jgi:hypothetical protein
VSCFLAGKGLEFPRTALNKDILLVEETEVVAR